MPRLVGYRERLHEPMWTTLRSTAIATYVGRGRDPEGPVEMRHLRHIQWDEMREVAKEFSIARTFSPNPELDNLISIFGFSITAGALCWAHDVAWDTTREERELCVEVMLHQLADTFSDRGS